MNIKHDFHIHTDLSICANNTATLDNYINIAKDLRLEKIGIANHFWDSRISGAFEFYTVPNATQSFEYIKSLEPQIRKASSQELKIYFGGEAEYAPMHHDISVSEEIAEQLDFILVSNSHTHITMPKELYNPYEKHVDYMIRAFEDIVNSKVSKHITAIAHPFDAVCCPYDSQILIDMIPDDTYRRLFDKAASKGIACELNVACMKKKSYEEIESLAHIRMFRLAKEAGCKFIFGSDAHDSASHERYLWLTDTLSELLELREDDIAKIAK